MEWYTGYDESHDLLAVLRFPDLLELWDGYSGVKLWRKVLGEPAQSMVFNPFDISSVVCKLERHKLGPSQEFWGTGKRALISGEHGNKGQRATCIKRLFWPPYEAKKRNFLFTKFFSLVYLNNSPSV